MITVFYELNCFSYYCRTFHEYGPIELLTIFLEKKKSTKYSQIEVTIHTYT
jgi:hypothetical protein